MVRFASCAAAALMLLGAPSQLYAQAAGNLDQADPPATKYATGDLDMDARAQASFPIAPQFRAFLPLSVDLSFRMPKVGNQGNANSCVAWALGYAVRSYYSVALENRDTGRQENIASPNYIYNVAKQLANAKKCDGGSSFDSNVKVLQKGALSLANYPYHDSDCDGAPAPQIIASASDFRIRGARMLDHKKLDDIKGALAQSNPVVISFSADKPFMQHRGDGVFASTVADKASAGWHAMALVGYDDRKQAFRLINSWGTGWGDSGYGWVGYDAIINRIRYAATIDVGVPPRRVADPRPPPPGPRPAPNPVPNSPPPRPVAEVAPPPPPSFAPPPAPPAPRRTPPPVVAPVPPVADVNPPPEPGPSRWHRNRPGPAVAEIQPAPPPPGPRPSRRERPLPPVAEVDPSAPTPTPPPLSDNPSFSDLNNLSCARVTVDKQGDQNVLWGFVASNGDLAFVRRLAAAIPNTAVGRIGVAPWPQCEVLQTLETALANQDAAQIDIGPSNRLHAGDTLRIAIQPPSQISFLYVSYIQADGSVVHLVQPAGIAPQPTLPGETLIFGDGAQGRDLFTIDAPFGRELIIAITSRSPLFEGPLPDRMTDREYLSALRRALSYKPDPSMPDREVSASMMALVTRPR
jgi:Papain family cysteine protease/Domain of unknown function (DUF4384)